MKTIANASYPENGIAIEVPDDATDKEQFDALFEAGHLYFLEPAIQVFVRELYHQGIKTIAQDDDTEEQPIVNLRFTIHQFRNGKFGVKDEESTTLPMIAFGMTFEQASVCAARCNQAGRNVAC